MTLPLDSRTMRLLKTLLKILGAFVLFMAIGFFAFYLLYNKPLPTSEKGPKADTLAKKMLKAVNYEAYRNTRYFEWTFRGEHRYKWDKAMGKAMVKWNDYAVNLNLLDTSKSTVVKGGVELSAKESKEIVQTAWDYFNNDSFWLVAPFKVFDSGAERGIVTFDDGSEGLLITYSSGGTTPGDSYLWKLQPSGFPESYSMWVKIIPIGGVKASWDDWKIMESGVFLPTSHEIGPMTLDMGDVKAYN